MCIDTLRLLSDDDVTKSGSLGNDSIPVTTKSNDNTACIVFVCRFWERKANHQCRNVICKSFSGTIHRLSALFWVPQYKKLSKYRKNSEFLPAAWWASLSWELNLLSSRFHTAMWPWVDPVIKVGTPSVLNAIPDTQSFGELSENRGYAAGAWEFLIFTSVHVSWMKYGGSALFII